MDEMEIKNLAETVSKLAASVEELKKKVEEPDEKVAVEEQKCKPEMKDEEVMKEDELLKNSEYTDFVKKYLNDNPGKSIADAASAYKAGNSKPQENSETQKLNETIVKLSSKVDELNEKINNKPAQTSVLRNVGSASSSTSNDGIAEMAEYMKWRTG